jgi:hypothetical protein
VLVKFSTYGGDSLDDPLLAGNEVGAHPRDQPGASTPKQPDAIEAEIDRFAAG